MYLRKQKERSPVRRALLKIRFKTETITEKCLLRPGAVRSAGAWQRDGRLLARGGFTVKQVSHYRYGVERVLRI